MSQREIAKAIGVEQKTISNDLRKDSSKKDEKSKENSRGLRNDSSKPTTGAAAAQVVAAKEQQAASTPDQKRRSIRRGCPARGLTALLLCANIHSVAIRGA